MAPSPITADYYKILEVEQAATPEVIIKSYRRLARAFHPDRNIERNTTADFQLIGEAYETLRDETKRRVYDLVYPSIRKTSRPSTTSDTFGEAAQIATLQRSKEERNAQWAIKKNAFESSIFELQRAIRQLEQEVRNLNSIAAAEAATESQRTSWTTWILSSLYKKTEDSEEEILRKDRARQERRIEKDMKERRLTLKKAEIQKLERLLVNTQKEIVAANGIDEGKIAVLKNRLWAREATEREEMDRIYREKLAKTRKQQQEQQEKREREAAEARWKQQAEERNRQQRQTRDEPWIYDDQPENRWHYMQYNSSGRSTGLGFSSSCHHSGWWPKVQGRTACPTCDVVWTYLLQCPGCQGKACPKCQSTMRPRIVRNNAKNFRKRRPK